MEGNPLRGVTAGLALAPDPSSELVFEEGRVVLIEGDRIAGTVSRAEVPEGVTIEDWGDVALMPGTVNSHGHSFQSLLKGFADDRSFESWRDAVLYPFSEKLDRNAIRVGALFAFAEALRAGVTTTVDFFYLHDAANDNAEEIIRAARDVGIRLVLARALYDPDAPTNAPARYREPAAESIERCRALAEKHRADPFVEVQPAPHSLHAASPETIRSGLELARAQASRCHLHLAEAAYERDQILERYGTTPVRLLAREGLLDPRLVAIHAVWVDDEEIDLLAEAAVKVVHCPGANAFLGDGIASVPEMRRRGVRVALGPDGGCANNRQSVFDEMRSASLFAKARLTDGAAMTAAESFAMGTVGGAEAIGLPVGMIERGAFADLVALDLADLSLQPRSMLGFNVVNSMQATAISKVMVGGELVLDGGRLVKIDEADLARSIGSVTRGWMRP